MRAAGATACSKEVGRTAGIVKRIWIKEVRGTQRHTPRPELSFVQMFFQNKYSKLSLLGQWEREPTRKVELLLQNDCGND